MLKRASKNLACFIQRVPGSTYRSQIINENIRVYRGTDRISINVNYGIGAFAAAAAAAAASASFDAFKHAEYFNDMYCITVT